MKPLLLLFWGILVVAVDLRIGMFDIVPDVVGWLMAVVALRRLNDRDGSFTIAAFAAGLGIVVGVAQLVAMAGLVTIGENVVMTAMVFATCTGIARITMSESIARRARAIRVADLVIGVIALPVVYGALTAAVDGVALLVLGLATFSVLIWLLVFLWSIKSHQEFQALPTSGGLVT